MIEVATQPPTARFADSPRAIPRSSDFMSVLAEIESTCRVLEWRVDGIPIWPLARLRWAFREWVRLYGDRASAPQPLRPTQRFQALLTGGLTERRVQRLDKAADGTHGTRHDLVFLSDGVSFAQLDGRWYERFCDPVMRSARELGLRCALWTPGRQRHVPRGSASTFVQSAIDRANVWGAVASMLGRDRCELPDLDRVHSILASRGFSSEGLGRRQIASDASRLLTLSRMFARRLRRQQPRLAFLVGYYGLEGMAFVLACRQSKIPVADLQHGVQGDMHPAYAAWPSMPGNKSSLLPDIFWVWSAWESQVIERWAGGARHRSVVGGNPWIEVWREQSGWPGVEPARRQARELKRLAGERAVALVTLQYGLRAEEQLLPLRELLARAAGEFVFWIRLHPAMLDRRDEIRSLLLSAPSIASSCDLDQASDLPLPLLLQQANVHVTHSSTTVIEAAQFGLRSVVTSEYGEELFPPLYEAGWAVTETGGPAAVTRAMIASCRATSAPASPASVESKPTLEVLLAQRHRTDAP